MTCTQTHDLINPYVDGELDLAATLDLERHLDRCPTCAQSRDRLQSLRTTIAESATRYTARTSLLQNIRAAIPAPSPAVSRTARFRHPIRIAAALLIAASLTWFAATRLSNPTANDTLARELVAAHVRSLQADHLLDVRSTDQHTVKPWFAGKLDFSPEVHDLADAGFPLEGGRLDYLDNRPVAALVYRHNRHVINCFVWPTADRDRSIAPLQGYALRQFTRHGLTYVAVSDTSPATLEEFVRALEAHPDAPPATR